MVTRADASHGTSCSASCGYWHPPRPVPRWTLPKRTSRKHCSHAKLATTES